MYLLGTRRGLLLGFVVLALVGAACGKSATASERGGSSSGSGSGTSTGSSGTSGGSGGYGAGGGGATMATTVLEGPDNGFTFSPSTVTVQKVRRSRSRTSVTPRTPHGDGQGIDIETMRADRHGDDRFAPRDLPILCRSTNPWA